MSAKKPARYGARSARASLRSALAIQDLPVFARALAAELDRAGLVSIAETIEGTTLCVTRTPTGIALEVLGVAPTMRPIALAGGKR